MFKSQSWYQKSEVLIYFYLYHDTGILALMSPALVAPLLQRAGVSGVSGPDVTRPSGATVAAGGSVRCHLP